MSEDGNVWSTTAGGPVPIRRPAPLPMTGWVDPDGYRHVSLVGLSGKRKRFAVHVLVLLTYVGPRPEECEETRHLDGDRLNNALANLAWGTRLENGADRVRHGRSGVGARNPKARLTEEDVRAILAAPRTLGSGVELAARYGVGFNTISRIRRGVYWRHIRGSTA